MQPWLERLSWDQMSFPRCAHKKITLWSGSERTICKAGDCLLLSLDSQFWEVFASKNPRKAEALVLLQHLVPVPMNRALQDLTPDGSFTAPCHTGVWFRIGVASDGSCQLSTGPRPMGNCLSHVDTLDVDNEDFLTVSQSHCLFYYRIIGYAFCRFIF